MTPWDILFLLISIPAAIYIVGVCVYYIVHIIKDGLSPSREGARTIVFRHFAISGRCFIFVCPFWADIILQKVAFADDKRTRSQNTQFAYSPLKSDRREIRLLRILPKSSSSDAELEAECDLLCVTLDDPNLQYEALSYVWGSATSRSRIRVAGKPFTVGENLHAALRALQLPEGDRIIWTDAICIDQSNLTERSEQVLLMRDIYTNAKKGVVVWLDENEAHVRGAVEFLEQARQHESPETWIRSTVGLDQYKNSWIAVTRLLNNNYWTRIWIVQELVCAQSISVHCGNLLIDWSLLVAVDSTWNENSLLKSDMSEWFIQEAVRVRKDRFVGAVADVILWFLSNVCADPAITNLLYKFIFVKERFWKPTVGPKFFETTRESRDSPLAQKSLFDLMCLHESSQATDPRDKIYGLLGIGVDTQNGKFEISYRISQYAVAVYFANFMINTVHSLDFICFPMICVPPFTPSMSHHKYKPETASFFRTMGSFAQWALG